VRLTTGTRLGAFEILAPLGAGGMGEVYRAHDSRLGRDVAIKLLPETLASSPQRLARLEREAKTVAGLNHPNIVTLHAMEETGPVRFLVMELVEGNDLSDIVTPEGLPLDRVLDVAIPLADALVAAHERRVVHRDLKPSNVMLTRDGRVKVLDFGLAKLTNVEAELEETRTIATGPAITNAGQVMGTVAYMAPEQLRGEEVDARADIFAFGIVVYELAAGQRPFHGGSSADLTSAILRDVPAPLSSLRADLPADLERILERCLEKNPRERFQTALDVANELRALKRAVERGGFVRAEPPSEKLATVAVLPFVNRSADPEDEYFSDGLADELLDLLAKIRGLRVAARTSAFRFKGKDISLAEIGRALGVSTILEGSVRKAGTRLRISVQLVKVTDAFPIWSETYDRTLEDIFAVQNDIAQAVVRELRTRLLGESMDTEASGEVRAEVLAAGKGGTTHPEAHRLFLTARYLAEHRTVENAASIREYLRQAVKLDPHFARAWVQLSRAYVREAGLGLRPSHEGFALAREAAERARALEPTLAEAHGQIAMIQMIYDWDWRGAEATLARRREFAPAGNTDAMLAARQGRFDEAIELYRRAIERDPLVAGAYHNLGQYLIGADRPLEAEEAFRKALEIAPQNLVTHALLSLTLVDHGRGEEALAEAHAEPNELFRRCALAIIRERLHDREESDRVLQEMIEKHGHSAGSQIAQVYAARGESDAAFHWLDQAYIQRDPGLSEIKSRPEFRHLYADPRWHAFMKRMGFED